MVKFIKTKEEFNALMEESKTKLVVIDFTASWCPPCRMIGPIFEQIAAANPEITCIKIDVDDAEELSAQCGISCMPTFQFYKGGAKIDEMEGANQEGLKEKIALHK